MSPFIPPSRVRHGDRMVARSVLCLLLAVFTATFTGLPDHTDSETEFQTTSALGRTGSLALGGTPEAEALVLNHAQAPLREGADGRYYSWFGVGQALLAVPLYWTGRLLGELFPAVEERHAATRWYGVERSEYFPHLLVGWRNALLTALTGWLVVRVARRLLVSRRWAWVAGLSYGLCTFAWPQARSTLSDVQATFFLFYAFALCLRLREAFDRMRLPSRRDLFGLGACLSLAFLTRVLTAPAIAALLALALWTAVAGARRLAREEPVPLRDLLKRSLWAVVPGLAGLAVFLGSNAIRFGDPFESGYGSAVFSGTFFAYPLHWGLAGLLLAPGKGLLWLAPAVVLVPLGLSRAWKQGSRPVVCTLLGVALAVFLPPALTLTWHGAWTYGPRYVLPALPFLWVVVALAMERVDRSWPGRVAAGALLAAGLVTNLPGVLVDHMTHQELALQAAREVWQEGLEEYPDPRQRDDALFQNIQWDWRFAAPWAHWRILRHRVAGLGEEFSAREIFLVESDAVLRPIHDREHGFLHLAWVDLERRLGGAIWPGILLVAVLLVLGAVQTARGLDPTAD